MGTGPLLILFVAWVGRRALGGGNWLGVLGSAWVCLGHRAACSLIKTSALIQPAFRNAGYTGHVAWLGVKRCAEIHTVTSGLVNTVVEQATNEGSTTKCQT